MDISAIFSAVSSAVSLGPVVTLLLVIAIVIERAFDRGWLKFGGTQRVSERSQLNRVLKQILESQQGLQLHYNHDTTELLRQITENQKTGISMISKTQETIREGFKFVGDKFSEYDKYGIKTIPGK